MRMSSEDFQRPRGAVDGIGNRCADRVNRFSEDTDDMSALHEGNPHLRDIIANGIIRSQGGCDQVDVRDITEFRPYAR